LCNNKSTQRLWALVAAAAVVACALGNCFAIYLDGLKGDAAVASAMVRLQLMITHNPSHKKQWFAPAALSCVDYHGHRIWHCFNVLLGIDDEYLYCVVSPGREDSPTRYPYSLALPIRSDLPLLTVGKNGDVKRWDRTTKPVYGG